MGEAKEITKIIIKGSSGYCAYSEAYKDRLTIEKEKISYEYLPEEETKINPVRKWNYTTNSPLYQTLYERIIKMLPEYLCKDPMELVMDIGGIEITVIYSDKTRYKQEYMVTGDFFRDLFVEIRHMIPETEYMPAVLLLAEDFHEEQDEYEIAINIHQNSTFNLKPINKESVRGEVMGLLVNGEEIAYAFQTVRDQLIFTNKRIIAVDVQGITGKRKSFTTLPYSKIQYFSIQTPGFMEAFPDSELFLMFSSGFTATFEFKEKVDVGILGRLISQYIL